MRARFQTMTQTFARSIIQPVMFMAVTGLLISIAAVLKLDMMPQVVRDAGNALFTVLNSAAIGQLSVIFCVGIAAATAKKNKTDAAILGITIYLIFLYANNLCLSATGRLAEPGVQGLFGTGQNVILGIQVTDMGVFLGIFLGCFVGFFVNRFGGIKFHQYLSPYEGTKFAYLLLIFATIGLAALISYVWPPINAGVTFIVGGMGSMGPLGFFLYGFLNRMLLPIGMHHLLWMPLYYTPLGGTAQIAGSTYQGAMNIWLAEIGNIGALNHIDGSVGYIVNFGYIALPIGIALALIRCARPENKARVRAILIPAVFASALAGITEPIEFLFLFVSPILWVAHGLIYGFALFISNVLGLHTVVEALINTIMYCLAVPLSLGHQWLIIPLGIGLGALEYFVFKFLIVKLKIATLGREEEQDSSVDATWAQAQEAAHSKGARKGAGEFSAIVEGLGGVDNIVGVNNCFSRLRIDVQDPTGIDVPTLKRYPSSGVIVKHNQVQIVVGLGVQDVREELEARIQDLRQAACADKR